MERAARTALLTLGFAILIGVGATTQGIPPGTVNVSDGTLKLGPEIWLALLGGAVTLGINLQMLRSVRSDLKAHISKFDAHEDKFERLVQKTLPDEYVRRDYWKEAIEDIRASIASITRRMR